MYCTCMFNLFKHQRHASRGAVLDPAARPMHFRLSTSFTKCATPATPMNGKEPQILTCTHMYTVYTRTIKFKRSSFDFHVHGTQTRILSILSFQATALCRALFRRREKDLRKAFRLFDKDMGMVRNPLLLYILLPFITFYYHIWETNNPLTSYVRVTRVPAFWPIATSLAERRVSWTQFNAGICLCTRDGILSEPFLHFLSFFYRPDHLNLAMTRLVFQEKSPKFMDLIFPWKKRLLSLRLRSILLMFSYVFYTYYISTYHW